MDENYLYRTIENKREIFREITLLRHALKPFNSLRTHVPNQQPNFQNKQALPKPETKSKHFYKILIQRKMEKPKSENKIQTTLNDNYIAFDQVYTRKIKRIKEKKLSEFNYKVLHNILPCKRNLKIWGKTNQDTCDVCRDIQDIKHLLFECQHARKIWHLIEIALGVILLTLK